MSLAWLPAQNPWLVPIPGTTEIVHIVENTGGATVTFTAAERAELSAAIRAIEVHGLRLPPGVLAFHEVDAPMKT